MVKSVDLHQPMRPNKRKRKRNIPHVRRQHKIHRSFVETIQVNDRRNMKMLRKNTSIKQQLRDLKAEKCDESDQRIEHFKFTKLKVSNILSENLIMKMFFFRNF